MRPSQAAQQDFISTEGGQGRRRWGWWSMRNAPLAGGPMIGTPAPLFRAQRAMPARRLRALAPDDSTAYVGETSGGEMGDKPAAKGLEWILEAGKALEQEAAMDVAEVQRIEQLEEAAGLKGRKPGDGEGVHLQGNTLRKEALFYDENDKRRATWHRKLHLCAEQGDFSGAEEVITSMRNSHHIPGPKAYHALIIAYVRGGNPKGALAAIREAWKHDIQPLAQSYAAIVASFLQVGDIDTATAVYSANRRSSVSAQLSWAALTTAMLTSTSSTISERAVALLELGLQEGLEPDRRLYEAIIKYQATRGELVQAMEAWVSMRERSWVPTKDTLSVLITAHALANKIDEAEALLYQELMLCPGGSTAATVGACNSMLAAYLRQSLTSAELATKLSRLRTFMVQNNISFDRKGYSLLVTGSIVLEDPQIGLLALKSLSSQGRGFTEFISDETLGQFLQLCSHRSMLGLCEVLEMITSDRPLSPACLVPDSAGRTFVTTWLPSASELAAAAEAEESSDEDDGELPATVADAEFILVDGVPVDPSSQCAVSAEGVPLAVTKMSVKELRAELHFRQAAYAGNKRDLIKRLQKARAEAEDGSSGKAQDAVSTQVTVVNESWSIGQLVEKQEKLENKKVIDDDDEEDDEDALGTVDELEETDAADQDDDDDDLEFGEYEDLILKGLARGKFQVDTSIFDGEPTILEALEFAAAVVETAGGVPSPADIAVLTDGVAASGDSEAEEKLADLLTRCGA